MSIDYTSASSTTRARFISLLSRRKVSTLMLLSLAIIFIFYSATAGRSLLSTTQTAVVSAGFVALLWGFLSTTHASLLAAQLKLSAAGLPSLPPGTMGSLFWGESLGYARSFKHASNPDIWYDERQAKYGNMFRTHLLGAPTVVLLGVEANKFVLSNENKLFQSSWPRSLRELEGKYAVSMVQGDVHKRLRRAVNTFLNINAVQLFKNQIEDIVIRDLTEGFQNSGPDPAAFPILERVSLQLNAELFMGLKPGPELDRLLQHYDNFSAGLASHPLNLPWTVFGKAMKSRAELLKYMFQKINARRKELSVGSTDDARDLLDLLIMSKDEETGNYYTVEEIADNMILMVHAGEATTASVLAAVLRYLSQSENVLAQLKAECRALATSQGAWNRVSREQLKSIDLLRSVISEGMRICPPVSGFFKRAKSDLVYEGFTIPEGWTVHLFTRLHI